MAKHLHAWHNSWQISSFQEAKVFEQANNTLDVLSFCFHWRTDVTHISTNLTTPPTHASSCWLGGAAGTPNVTFFRGPRWTSRDKYSLSCHHYNDLTCQSRKIHITSSLHPEPALEVYQWVVQMTYYDTLCNSRSCGNFTSKSASIRWKSCAYENPNFAIAKRQRRWITQLPTPLRWKSLVAKPFFSFGKLYALNAVASLWAQDLDFSCR